MNKEIEAKRLQIEADQKTHEYMIHNLYPRPIAEIVLSSTDMMKSYLGSTTAIVLLIKIEVIDSESNAKSTSKTVPANQTLLCYGAMVDLVTEELERHGLYRVKISGLLISAVSGLYAGELDTPGSAYMAAGRIIQRVRDSRIMMHKNKMHVKISIAKGLVCGGIVKSSTESYDIHGPAVQTALGGIQFAQTGQILCNHLPTEGSADLAFRLSTIPGYYEIVPTQFVVNQQNEIEAPVIALADQNFVEPEKVVEDQLGRKVYFHVFPIYFFHQTNMERDYMEVLQNREYTKTTRNIFITFTLVLFLHGYLELHYAYEFGILQPFDISYYLLYLRISVYMPILACLTLGICLLKRERIALVLKGGVIQTLSMIILSISSIWLIAISAGLLMDSQDRIPALDAGLFFGIEAFDVIAVAVLVGVIPPKIILSALVVWHSLMSLIFFFYWALFRSTNPITVIGWIGMFVTSTMFFLSQGLIYKDFIERKEFAYQRYLAKKLEDAETERQLATEVLQSVLGKSLLCKVQTKGVSSVEYNGLCAIVILELRREIKESDVLDAKRLFDEYNGLLKSIEIICSSYDAEVVKSFGQRIIILVHDSAHISDQVKNALCLSFDVVGITQQLWTRELSEYTCSMALGVGPIVTGILGQSYFSYDVTGPIVSQVDFLVADGPDWHIQVHHSALELVSSLKGYEIIPKKQLNQSTRYYVELSHDPWSIFTSYAVWAEGLPAEPIIPSASQNKNSNAASQIYDRLLSITSNC